METPRHDVLSLKTMTTASGRAAGAVPGAPARRSRVAPTTRDTWTIIGTNRRGDRNRWNHGRWAAPQPNDGMAETATIVASTVGTGVGIIAIVGLMLRMLATRNRRDSARCHGRICDMVATAWTVVGAAIRGASTRDVQLAGGWKCRHGRSLRSPRHQRRRRREPVHAGTRRRQTGRLTARLAPRSGALRGTRPAEGLSLQVQRLETIWWRRRLPSVDRTGCGVAVPTGCRP